MGQGAEDALAAEMNGYEDVSDYLQDLADGKDMLFDGEIVEEQTNEKK